MITNNGKQLIGKFLLSQAPNFATHIAAGVGPRALLPNEELSGQDIAELKAKTALDFEVFRVPISAKGFIKENGVEKIVFKAEMPTEQRYQITEVGFFPAAENSVAGSYDSKALATFVPTETWVLKSGVSSSTINNITDDALVSNNDGDFLPTDIAYFINSNALVFEEQDRKERQETPRFYNKGLVLVGNSSNILSDFSFGASASPTYRLENSTLSFNFIQNLPPDEIKLAFSLISKLKTNNANPSSVRIIFDFVNEITGAELNAPKARAEIELTAADFVVSSTPTRPAAINRYHVVTKTLADFTLDDTFSWANINVLRIYGCVIVDGSPSSDYSIIFDGLRLDNVSSQNPLYTMVGYDIMRNDNAYPILKAENTNNYIEYRFGIGVDTSG